MDTVFVEEHSGDTYRIAVIDRDRIFSAQNPGELATIFESSRANPSREDDAQIFYALASSIGAEDVFADLNETYRSHKLNTWSIGVKDRDVNNLFLAVKPIDRAQRLELYSQRHSITPIESVTSESDSLFTLVAFAEKQTWKTGILQRCVDCLVKQEHRGKPEVYSVIDEEYRRLMRFKLETEIDRSIDPGITARLLFIRRVVQLLGLKNTHDTTPFTTIPISVGDVLTILAKMIPSHTRKETVKDQLSDILTLWSGASVKEVEGGFQLEVEPNILQGLEYMQPLLTRPEVLVVLDTPM